MRELRANAFFVVGLLLWWLVCVFWLLQIETGEAIFFFSDRRTPWGDAFFRVFTKMGEEPVYILLTLLFLFWRLRYALLLPLTGFLVTLVSALSKGYFAHPRPAAYLAEVGLMDRVIPVFGVEMHHGATSFPSGHTLSAFALYTLLALLATRKRWTGPLLLSIAVLVAISRIYLVQHFLKDVFFGSVLGALLGLGIYYLNGLLPGHTDRWYNKSLPQLFGVKHPQKADPS